MKAISLSQLTTQIQETLRQNFDAPIWIQAEISELRENPGGHCYLELIEKDNESEAMLAKTKATIWASTYRLLKPYFENTTGQPLRSGLNISVAVVVEFHGVYGFSLNIRDIDPTFTVGEMAVRRLQTIRQLETDGIADMNKELILPELLQRLAIISSPTAAGYGDFCDQLENSGSKFVFYKKLFPSIMQGDQAEQSIISALEKVYENNHLFDAVVIIRGGGATADLACFDSYELALNCAQFPLPIISGIGHQRDVSILDMIANTTLKTPTAVAEFLISNLQDAKNKVVNITADIQNVLKQKLEIEYRMLDNSYNQLQQITRNWVMQRNFFHDKFYQRLKSIIKLELLKQNNLLQILEKNIETHSPAFLLKHGYTITVINGRRITSVKQVNEGDKIRTFAVDGNFESQII